jgi:hypothetical protein
LCEGWIPNNDEPGAYPGALSRFFENTEICSDCGQAEAIYQYLMTKYQPIMNKENN